jgi:hypothetical protein
MNITFDNDFLSNLLCSLKSKTQKTSKLEPLPQSVIDLLNSRPGHMVRVVCKEKDCANRAQGKARKLSTKRQMRKQLRIA